MDIELRPIPVPGGVDEGIAWHYGDPLREQRVLAESAGVVDRGNRDVLTVTGPDRLSWLHTICSQHVADLDDGGSTEALVLSPHGHVEQHWQLTELGETAWIDTEPGEAAEVLGYLDKMRFLKRVENADVSADWAVLTLAGPSAGAVLETAGLPRPKTARAEPLPGGGFVRATARALGGVDLVVPRGGRDRVLAALCSAGARPAGTWAFEALRVAAREPRLRFETDHRTIPHEVGWIGRAVHLHKGCYRGQETVARVHNLGRPPRRLVFLHLDGSDSTLPATGDPVSSDDRQVGYVGTAVRHYELGPVALAVVKRNTPDDAELIAGGVPAKVERVVDV